ncbi:hypothetical protein [Streptomyces sp. NPDC050416]|uniref:hypothetical protein n=1 Tax=Streptomyces sp. NPDC050416 TaxID=3365611 RepID=UPI00378C7958
MPQKGRRIPARDQLSYTADFAWPDRWWIAGTDGKPPRAATRYERARVASLALQKAIRAARTASAARDEAPAATASAAAHAADHNHGQEPTAPHAVDHPDRDPALTPAQRAAAVHAHQQAAMPELLEGRMTDPATWMRTPENLDWPATITRATDARRRAIKDRELSAPATPPADPRRQEHEQQHQQPGPTQGRGPSQK